MNCEKCNIEIVKNERYCLSCENAVFSKLHLSDQLLFLKEEIEDLKAQVRIAQLK